ncbi:MAG: sialidase-1 [Pirellulaceae bacterium]|jgi:sialidase-1
MNRRHFLTTSSTSLLASSFLSTRLLATRLRADDNDVTIHDTRIISKQPQKYHGWPTLARRSNGELVVVCSGGRVAHVCPYGQVEIIRSKDDGKTWTWPRVLLDGPIDDRDAGVLETAKGSLLVTTFTSNAYESGLAKNEEWKSLHERIPAEARRTELGTWMIRSTDGGVSWSARYDSKLNSPHGPVQLKDGRLLYAGKNLWRDEVRVGVCHSTDDGQSWEWLADIPTREGDLLKNYHELHAIEAADGTIVVHIRNHNSNNSGETLQTESKDGGKTWNQPHPIGVWGLPSHLLRLSDDRLLMSYGHRRKPFGNQARVSSDNGATWSSPYSISKDGLGGDLGYPSTVQLADGSLITVWYERMSQGPMAVLRLAHWSLPK